MKKDLELIKFRPEWFGAYQLDKDKNFLCAPDCPCGCGGKCDMLLDSEKDLFSLAYSLLMDHKCNHCAIFAHAFNGKMFAIIKTETSAKEPVSFYGIDETDMNFFKEWDDELQFHCYGILVEKRPGVWKILET